MTLVVHKAQQQARINIANRHKAEPHNIPTPVSVDVFDEQRLNDIFFPDWNIEDYL